MELRMLLSVTIQRISQLAIANSIIYVISVTPYHEYYLHYQLLFRLPVLLFD
jgi:hypothetical protein